VTHSPYARAPDLSVTLSRTAGQYLTPFFHQHTEVKDVITSKLTADLKLIDNLIVSPDTPTVNGELCLLTLQNQ
jgi:hypothetical protein